MKKESIYRKNMFFALSVCIVLLAGSCAATRTLIEKRKLTVETKMSETIFLEPVSPEKRVVFVDVKNTTDKDMVGIEYEIKGRVAAGGYTVTDDPTEATYILQANVLQVGKSDLDDVNAMLGTGFEGVVEGAVLGGVIGGAIGGDVDEVNKGTVIGGVAGGVAGFIFDALVTDVLFTMVTDIQISKRAGEGETVSEREETSASQGTATSVKQTSSTSNVSWKIYRTRIVSVANKANLDFEEARPLLKAGLVRSIGGIF
ncbi:MAG: complement resistance protein TraT [Candidatus Dadabacteria bacterium]|nr:complement resistance protein TraT [Candidatus Dadabacteria bacterium]MCY4262912.1 complement resistance protein TraT [Candidatus Dadabacteria bacterium]